MSKTSPNPGILGIAFVMKAYHSVIRVILKERGQTHAEAAAELNISAMTFGKLYRLEYIPNFTSNFWKLRVHKLEEWSTVPIEALFPEAFFRSECFVNMPRKWEITRPYRLLMNGEAKNGFPALAKSSTSSKPPSPAKRKRRKKQKKQTRVDKTSNNPLQLRPSGFVFYIHTFTQKNKTTSRRLCFTYQLSQLLLLPREARRFDSEALLRLRRSRCLVSLCCSVSFCHRYLLYRDFC